MKPNYNAWFCRGNVLLYNLGKNKEAIASYDKAIEFEWNYEIWFRRGFALGNLGRNEEALASYDKAIEIKPDEHEAWNNRGVALINLGRNKEAIASFDKAIEIKPDEHQAWSNRSIALDDLWQQFKEAIPFWDKAIKIKPDNQKSWYSQDMVTGELRRNEEAIASFDQAIEFKPDNHETWNQRGMAMVNMGRIEEAIAFYDQAIRLKVDYYEAWLNRGVALRDLGRSEEAISSSFEAGLKYIQKDKEPKGWGKLHHAIGRTYYLKWIGDTRSFTNLYAEAINSYNQALTTLTAADFPEEHLEVLQDSIRIKASRSLQQTAKATQQLQRDGTELLRSLLAKTQDPDKRKQIQLELDRFQDLTVDIAVQSGDFITAINMAEEGKNTYLYWLLEDDISPKYPEFQQLLNPTTAAVYWHLSPYALHTFIIKSGESTPIVIGLETESLTRLDKFEEWVKKWNQEYAKGKGEKQEGGAQTWRDNLAETLKELGNILNIAAIEEEVKGIKNLILIPHRDLHRFPLHALFSDQFIISYLPSAKVGIELAKKQTDLLTNEVKLLSIEHPTSAGFDSLPDAQIESVAITALFPNSTRIQSAQVTEKALETNLANPHQILHFTGHATYNFKNPKLSYLALAGQEMMTMENLLKFNLTNYQLVTLSACETAVTGNQTITTEYVGLVSAFIHCGVSHVVSTLWTVESGATALIMIKFYRLFKKGVSAPVALKKAQKWLRNLTPRQLTRIYQTVVANLPDEQWLIKEFLCDKIKRYAMMESSPKLFNHPYHWSAFVITGLPADVVSSFGS
ncbi:hypothetical protein BCD67_15650 [Oscillatoriales cyanobacterium USR001]|nr:hypothetical protein BCD67_15650 [Oscillatoriales cyanobacterium USR001]